MPILTDIYLYNKKSYKTLDDYISKIFQYVQKYEVEMPSKDVCLVLELRESGRCGYYFVDHKNRCLFWLEEYDLIDSLASVRVKYTPSLVGEPFQIIVLNVSAYVSD